MGWELLWVKFIEATEWSLWPFALPHESLRSWRWVHCFLSCCSLVLNMPDLQLQDESWSGVQSPPVSEDGLGVHTGQGAYFLHSSTPPVSEWNRFSTSNWESCKSPWALGLWKAHKLWILRKVQHLAIIYRTMTNAMNSISWDPNRVEGEEIQIYGSYFKN